MENGIKERNISTRFELSIEKLKSNIIHEVDLSNDKCNIFLFLIFHHLFCGDHKKISC